MRWALLGGIFLLVCVAALGLGLPAMASASSTTTITGMIPLVIHNTQASNITDLTATTSWTTNGEATSQIFYDTTIGMIHYAYSSPENSTTVIQHSVNLSGLSPSTTYHYTVRSVATIGGVQFVAVSPDFTFTTLGAYIAGGNIISCDAAGNERNQFAPGESVYAKATGLEGNTEYRIWIQDHPVAEGDPLVIGENPSTETPKLVTTAPDGSVGPTLIWQIPSNAPVTYEYDIVFDKQGDGDNTGNYNAASDGIDSFSVVGFAAPVPELATILLFGMGLACLGGYFGLRRARCRNGRIS